MVKEVYFFTQMGYTAYPQDKAKEAGHTPGPDKRGYVVRVNVADSDERAYEEGKHFYWQLGTSFGISHPHWMSPPGYSTRSAQQSARGQRRIVERRNVTSAGADSYYEEAQASSQVITGSPDTVIEKMKKLLDIVDPSWLVFWGREGQMSHETAMRSIDLLGQEVIPALKDYVPERAR